MFCKQRYETQMKEIKKLMIIEIVILKERMAVGKANDHFEILIQHNTHKQSYTLLTICEQI